MKTFFQKPYLAFWMLIPFVLLIGIILGDKTLDINIHDTYFVFTQLHFSIFICLLIFIVGLIYFLLYKIGRKTVKFLTLFHFLLTVIPIILIFILLTKLNIYSRSEYPIFDDLAYVNIIFTLSILAFLFGGLIVFPANFIISFFRKKS